MSGSISTHLKVRRERNPVEFLSEIYLLGAAGETCVRLVDGLSVGMDTLYNLAINPLDEEDRMLQFFVVDGEIRMRARHPFVLSKDSGQVGSVKVFAGQKVILPIGEICFSQSFAPMAATEEYMVETRKTEKSQPVECVARTVARVHPEPDSKQQAKPEPTSKKVATNKATAKQAAIKEAAPEIVRTETGTKPNTNTKTKAKAKNASNVLKIPLPLATNETSSTQHVRGKAGNARPQLNASERAAKISRFERFQFFYWQLNRDARVLKTLGGLLGFGLGMVVALAVLQMEAPSIKLSERETSNNPILTEDPVALRVPLVDEEVLVEVPEPEPEPQSNAQNVEKIPELVLQLAPPTLPRFVDRTLDEAQRLLSEGKVVWPIGHNAVELTLSVLATEPDNPRGIQLLKNARYILLTVAQDSYEEGYRHDAYDLVERILAFDPGEHDVAVLRDKWINDRPAELRYLTRHRTNR